MKKKIIVKITRTQRASGEFFTGQEQYIITNADFGDQIGIFVLSSLFQVHGHHPPPPAPTVGHSHQGGHLRHLGPGSPPGLPPGLLLNHGDHAQPSGVHDRLAGASQQDL